MGNWGDESDFEAKAITDYKGRFTVNFKKIYFDVDEISQRTLEVTEKHPKDSLLKLWAGAMVGLFIFFLLTYQILAIVTIPFIIFYTIALFRIFKCWVSFKYNAASFILMSIVSAGALFALSRVALSVLDKVL